MFLLYTAIINFFINCLLHSPANAKLFLWFYSSLLKSVLLIKYHINDLSTNKKKIKSLSCIFFEMNCRASRCRNSINDDDEKCWWVNRAEYFCVSYQKKISSFFFFAKKSFEIESDFNGVGIISIMIGLVETFNSSFTSFVFNVVFIFSPC